MSAPQMSFISVPGLEKPVSKLIMGSMMLSDERMEYSAALLDAYMSIGGNAIDTAHVYGPHGMKAIGNWMQERNNRSAITLIGKGAHPDAAGPRMTKSAIDADLSDSLERMQTGYVDIFMLHRDDTDKTVGEIVEMLQEPLEAGLCLALGASNWTITRLGEANDYAARHGLTGFACNSPNLSLAKPNEPRWAGCVSAGSADITWHTRTQLPLLSWSSQAGGFFTGRFAPDKREDPEAVRVYYNEENWERYRRASRLAEAKGADANQIALAYVLHQPFPTCALIGPQTPEEVFSSAEGLQVHLTPEEIRWLDLQG